MGRISKYLTGVIVLIWLISPIPEITLIVTYILTELGFKNPNLIDFTIIFTSILILSLAGKKLGIDKKINKIILEKTGINILNKVEDLNKKASQRKKQILR